MIYKATANGDNNFHCFCDNKGPTAVLIKANNAIFGGYSKCDWEGSSSKFCKDNTSFLFSITNKKKYLIQNSIYATYNVNQTYIMGYGYPDGIILYTDFLTTTSNQFTVGKCYDINEIGLANGKKSSIVQECEVFTLYYPQK